jgi:hypothetical protein
MSTNGSLFVIEVGKVIVQGIDISSTLHVNVPVPWTTRPLGKVNLIFPPTGMLVFTEKSKAYSVGLMTY